MVAFGTGGSELGAFLPAGAVTGIGSLPFEDPVDAVDAVAQWCPELPFWPQPPALDPASAAVTQVIDPGTHLFDEHAGGQTPIDGPVQGSSAVAFAAFERALRGGAFPHARGVKGQLTGPVTLSYLLRLGAPAGGDRTEIVRAMAQRVTAQAVWQVQRLRHRGVPVVLFVDEPALGLVDEAEARQVLPIVAGVLDAVRRAGGIAGLHCCTTSRIGWLAATQPDVLSFDAMNGEVFTDDRLAQRHWASGGSVAFGLVPVATAPTSADDLFVQWLASGMRIRGLAGLAQRTIITSTCGLGHATADQAADAFTAAASLSTLIAKVAATSAVSGAPPPPTG